MNTGHNDFRWRLNERIAEDNDGASSRMEGMEFSHVREEYCDTTRHDSESCKNTSLDRGHGPQEVPTLGTTNL
jgi:hypothetical protein